jgi:hypothetical protein
MPQLPTPRPQPTGALATWWAPIPSIFDPRAGSAAVKVGVYLDEQAYLDGMQPMETHTLDFTADQLTANNVPSLELTALLHMLAATREPFAPPAEAPEEPPPAP